MLLLPRRPRNRSPRSRAMKAKFASGVRAGQSHRVFRRARRAEFLVGPAARQFRRQGCRGVLEDVGFRGRGRSLPNLVAKSPVPSAEVVVSHVQGDGSNQVLKLLAEAQRQSREPAKHGPHGQVRAFDVRRANVALVYVAAYHAALRADHLRGTVASWLLRVAVVLYQDAVIGAAGKCRVNRIRVGRPAVRGRCGRCPRVNSSDSTRRLARSSQKRSVVSFVRLPTAKHGISLVSWSMP